MLTIAFSSATVIGNLSGRKTLPYMTVSSKAWRTISYNMAAAHANYATFWTLIYKRRRELYKKQYGNFPNLVKNYPCAPQASIYSHGPKSSSQKGCMNFSLNSIFSKYTANSDFSTPLNLCPFSTTSAIHLFKNSTWLCRRTGKKQVSSCSCLRSSNRIRITRSRTLF